MTDDARPLIDENDPPLRFDNATAVREIAYRCAGAGSGAVMRLAGDVVMPAAEIGEAVEAILCDFWPEAAERDQAWRWKRGNPYRGHACEGDDCPGCGYESSWNEGFAAGRAALPDKRLREALTRANDDLIQIADYSPSEVADAIDSVRAAIKDALAADREKPETDT